MLNLAWVRSLSLLDQEHRPRLLTWAPRPHPSSVPTPRRGHTPSAIRTVRRRGEDCESKPVHLPGGTRLLKKKKCTVNLFKTTATNTKRNKMEF